MAITAHPSRAATAARLGDRLLPVAVAVVVVALAATPVVFLIYGATRGEDLFGLSTAPSLEALKEVYSDGEYLSALLRSIELAAIVSVLSVGVGGTFAWLVARTDVPSRRRFRVAMLLPIFASPFVGAVAWANLASERVGYLNELTGGHLGLNVYSTAGVVWLMALFFTPFAYLFTVGSFDRMNAALEEAALTSGASQLRVLTRITLPMAAPALLTGLVFVFVLSIETYTIPRIFGGPAGYSNLAVKIFVDANSSPPRLAHAAGAGTMILIVTVLGVALQRWLARHDERYKTIGGRGFGQAVFRLGKLRWPAWCAMWLYIFAAAVLPLGALLFQSLTPFAGAGLSHLTLENYSVVLGDPLVRSGIRNTVLLSFGTVILVIAIGTFVAYRDVHAGRSWTPRAVSFLAALPIAVPGVVMGLAFVLLGLQTPLYGTFWLLLLVFVTKYLPYASNISRNGLLQVEAQMEEAADVAGAGRLERLGRIVVPLIGPSLASGAIFVTILATQEVAASIFVASTGNGTLPVMTWNYMYAGQTARASALGVIQVVLLAVLVVIARRLTRGRLEENFG